MQQKSQSIAKHEKKPKLTRKIGISCTEEMFKHVEDARIKRNMLTIPELCRFYIARGMWQDKVKGVPEITDVET